MTSTDPQSIVSLVGDTLLTKVGETVETEEALKDSDIVCFYFSAHWCPPCRNFTPSLVNFYNTIGASEKVTIIFVSSDSDNKSFEEYYGSMSYLALPFDSKNINKQLNKAFNVAGIPCLVVMDAKTGNFITKEGRSDVGAAGDGKDEAKAKSVVAKWKSAESVPLSEAKLGGGGCTIS